MSSSTSPPPRFKPKRALLKVSGAGFGADDPLDPDSIEFILERVRTALDAGIEVALVIGGGNILRGDEQKILDRTAGDMAGMIATIVNGVVLKAALQESGTPVLLQSALPVDRVAEPVDVDRAQSYLEDGGVVIFAGGTGNPYFTTDSAAALRAGEIGADVILKGTDVDGVYSGDPAQEEAQFLSEVTYREITEGELGVIDLTAANICRKTEIPMVVYDLFEEGNTRAALNGEEIGTYVYPEGK